MLGSGLPWEQIKIAITLLIPKEEKTTSKAKRTVSVTRKGVKKKGWRRIGLRKELESLQEEAKWDRLGDASHSGQWFGCVPISCTHLTYGNNEGGQSVRKLNCSRMADS